MRLRIREDSLPRLARDIFPGIRVDAWEIFSKSHKLRTKACFFHSRKDLRAAWNRLCLLRGDGRNHHRMGCAVGFVHQCWSEYVKDGKSTLWVDKRYSSIICLLVPKLSYEVAAHEALHAGMAHARRITRNPGYSPSEMDQEELAAYPCGFIAHSIIRIAQGEGWLT